MFGWKQVFSGYSLDKYNKVLDALANNDIKYNTDIKNQDNGAIGRGATRASSYVSDTSMNYSKIYCVSVKKKDYDKAVFLINSNDC